jgi:hypothetical protein
MLSMLPANFTFDILLDCGLTNEQLSTDFGNVTTKIIIPAKNVSSYHNLKEQVM